MSLIRWAYRTFFGGAAVNALQPAVPMVYLRLRYRDPEGTVRDFPPNYPVRVRFGQGSSAVQVTPSPPVQAGGALSFAARTRNPWQFFTLDFSAANVPYIVCERLGSPPASPPQFTLAPGL